MFLGEHSVFYDLISKKGAWKKAGPQKRTEKCWSKIKKSGQTDLQSIDTSWCNNFETLPVTDSSVSGSK